jgi:Short C-terminal domain
MLFLYRPRQTWMPYRLPRQRTEQAAYNRHLQDQFGATRRVAPSAPAPDSADTSPSTEDVTVRLRELAGLHADGALNDEEFAAAKARLLGSTPTTP